MKLAVNRVVKGWRSAAEFTLPVGDFKENKVSAGRRFIAHTKTSMAADAFREYGLSVVNYEPLFGHMIGNNYADGAFVHTHTDPAPAGFAHVRCNWMIKKPPIGGDPVLDGELVQVEEGDLWLCIASMEEHGTTAIYGGERLIYSFGALIPVVGLSHIVAA